MKWKKGKFLRALKDRPMPVAYQGWLYRGLGMCIVHLRSAKTGDPTRWCLTHIGTGHAICFIDGEIKEALTIAGELAEAMDWTFVGLSGWRNIAPDMPQITTKWMERHPREVIRLGPANSYEKQEILANKVANRSSL